MAPNGNALIGVGLTTLGQVCFLLDAKDLEGLSKTIGQTVEQIQAIGIEDVLGWHSKCAQLAIQADVDALPAAGVTGGGGGDQSSWANEVVAVCMIFIATFLAMLVYYARLQRVDADEDAGGDDGAYQGGVASVASVTEL